jgi:predicted ATPase
MSYNERTEIELAPLTVLLGPNSSGKSSALRALRTLRDFPLFDWNLESGPAHRSQVGGN